MLDPQIHALLMKLLPKLAATRTDKYRLKVLAEIDGALAANGLTWRDVAYALRLPTWETFEADDLLALIAFIKKHARLWLSDNAVSFLADVGERASWGDPVELTDRQAAWLRGLHEQAERMQAERMASIGERGADAAETTVH